VEDIALRERGVDRDRRTVAVRGVGGQADGTDRTRESFLISEGCTWFNDRDTGGCKRAKRVTGIGGGQFRGVVTGFPAKDDGVAATAEGRIAGKG